MTPHQLINQTSGDVEYYTPSAIIAAARSFLHGIELDPASSAEANKRVMASRIFTREDNGLTQSWTARSVWMNHPFSGGWKACSATCNRKTCKTRGHVYADIPSNADWINKFVGSWLDGMFAEGCCITFAATSEEWFQPLLKNGTQCFLTPRTNYHKPDGTLLAGVSKGSAVTYLGSRVGQFREAFKHLGCVKL